VVIRVHNSNLRRLTLIATLFMALALSPVVFHHPVSSKGFDDDFFGREYLEVSWVRLIGNKIVGPPLLTDLDRDGFKEVLISTPHNLYCINSDGSLRWETYLSSTLTSRMTIADLNEDGAPDILVTGKSSLICLSSQGVKLWEYYTSYELEDYTPCVFDMDGDNHLDILVSTAKTTSQPFLLNHNGEFIKEFNIELDYAGFWTDILGGAPTIADLDYDGELEIILIGNDYKLHCMTLQGEQKWIANPTMRGDALFSIADLDDDDSLEIIIGNIVKLYCFDHEGNIEWTYQQKHANNRSNLMSYDPCIADVNDDGMLEIVSSSYDWETGRGQVFCIDSTGKDMWNFNSTLRVGSPALLDIDNDGKLETLFSEGESHFVVLNVLGQLMLYRDLGSMSKDPPLIADIDLDSNLEVIVSRPVQEDLYCFELTESTNSTGSWWTYGGSYLHHGRPDSDGDYLDDLIESNYYHTDVYKNDTDDDLLPDYWEIEYRLNPLEVSTNQDPDGDGFSNLEEYHSHTNPRKFNNWPLFYGVYLLPVWLFLTGLVVFALIKIKTIASAIKKVAMNLYVYIRVRFAEDIRSHKEIFQEDIEILHDFEDDLKNGK